MAATQRYFSRQPPKSWKLWPPWPPLALVQSWLQANNYKLQILSFSIINLLSSASSSSSSSRISSDSSKSSSLLLGSKDRCCGADWLRFFHYFLQPNEYRFLICQINGDYPPLITTLLKLQHSFYQSQLQLVVVAALHGDPVVFASDALA